MEHRRKRWGFALTEIFMSLLIVISAVILVVDWKHYEYFFIIAFAAAALLFLARGIRTIGEDKSHTGRRHIVSDRRYIYGELSDGEYINNFGRQSVKQKLLELLQSTEGFLSGQELSDHLNVSRTAVWKVMKSLEEDGYEIEAVRNKGYSLKKEPDILTKESCASRINTKWLGKNLMVYDVTDSTNTRLKLAGEQGAPNGSVAVANAQEAGKGRLGRHWETPKGSALAFSMLLRPQIQPENASMLTLVAALAVSRAIDEFAGIKTQIKWPNDIVYQGKKLCGILTEMSADMDQIHYVIVGIGINVQMTDFPKEIQNTATSLKLVTGKTLLRNELLAKVLEEFEVLYEQFVSAESLKNLKAEYESRLANKDNRVNVLAPSGAWQGICLGIKEDGALLVQREDGKVEEVIAGEVSVRGIYGYV